MSRDDILDILDEAANALEEIAKDAVLQKDEDVIQTLFFTLVPALKRAVDQLPDAGRMDVINKVSAA